MQHYIYVIKNETTGEYYIGKRSSADYTQDAYMGSGKLLKRKMKAHPDHEWTKEVLMLLDSASEAYEMEKHLIGDRWLTDSRCLNLNGGGKGGGLCESDLINRKRLQRLWEDGEDLGVTGVELSHDERQLRACVNLQRNSAWREQVGGLLAMGFCFGSNQTFPKVKLATLGLANALLAPADIQGQLQKGELPAGLRGFYLQNHALQLRVSIACSPRAVAVAQRLLNKGWEVGGIMTYATTTLRELGDTRADEHEEAFLAGLNCPVTTMRMQSPCKSFYVTLRRRVDHSFNETCEPLYRAGWRFGCATTSQKKLRLSEALQLLKSV